MMASICAGLKVLALIFIFFMNELTLFLIMCSVLTPFMSLEMRAHLLPCSRIFRNSSRSSAASQLPFETWGLMWLIQSYLQSRGEWNLLHPLSSSSSSEILFHLTMPSCSLLLSL